MSRLFMLAAAGLVSSALSTAHAQSFNFYYTQGSPDFLGVTESGVLTTQATSIPGEYQITGITGEQVFYAFGTPTEEAITGLLFPDTAYSADDLLFLNGGPYLDIYGFTFTVDGFGADGAGDVNIALVESDDGTMYPYTTPYEILDPYGSLLITPVSPVPEPASYTLLLAGLGLIMAAGTRRRASLRRRS